MGKLTARECRSTCGPGTITLSLEVYQEGRAELLCPCCDGNGEHSTHSGNDPRDLAYTCSACEGYGTLTGIPNLVAGRRGRRESRWTGSRVTDTLEIRPSLREHGTWTINGLRS